MYFFGFMASRAIKQDHKIPFIPATNKIRICKMTEHNSIHPWRAARSVVLSFFKPALGACLFYQNMKRGPASAELFRDHPLNTSKLHRSRTI